MKTKTIACVECGEKVSYGRLSCPACGALLASVAGGPARHVPESTPVEAHDGTPVSVAAAAEPAEVTAAAVEPDAPGADAEAEPGTDADSAELELEPAAFSLSPEPT